MPDIVIYKDETGKFVGMGEKGRRAWAKFCKVTDELEPGETIKFAYSLPRSGVHHKYFFAKITGLLERQEQFEDKEALLEWLKVGAGHVDFMPGAKGELVAMPRSINFATLEEQGFIEFHREVADFLWTPRAMAYLWPHLSEEHQYECIDHWHRDFERPQTPRIRKPAEEVAA